MIIILLYYRDTDCLCCCNLLCHWLSKVLYQLDCWMHFWMDKQIRHVTEVHGQAPHTTQRITECVLLLQTILYALAFMDQHPLLAGWVMLMGLANTVTEAYCLYICWVGTQPAFEKSSSLVGSHLLSPLANIFVSICYVSTLLLPVFAFPPLLPLCHLTYAATCQLPDSTFWCLQLWCQPLFHSSITLTYNLGGCISVTLQYQ